MNKFGETATKLSGNPLGIIALCIVFVYGLSFLMLTNFKNISATAQYFFLAFIIGFPLVVYGGFLFLVTKHHSKLYAPKDFPNPDDFTNCLYGNQGKAKTRMETFKEEPILPDVSDFNIDVDKQGNIIVVPRLESKGKKK